MLLTQLIPEISIDTFPVKLIFIFRINNLQNNVIFITH